ncbi:SapC family protein [Microbulbifer hainanensis]|uniref:SapC family protein n=1 Tax=Microbulbifer hainanensis TaxID=2735675 RepID=UPI0018665A71|nr:SapC family protein [Microbulbifer hainanensis]
MTNHVLLNNVSHKDLKIITDYSASYGDDVGAVVTFPTEFGDIQREYPILLHRDGDQFQAVALLGFRRAENLFLENGDWNASYVPAIVARGPFLIGFQEQEVDGELRRETVIHVDMDNPRVNESRGQAVFLPHGGNSPYLDGIASTLRKIHAGMEIAGGLYSALDACGLIESVSISVEIHRDEHIELGGYYTVNEEKLAALDGASLEKLNRAGYLREAFLLAASLHNIKKLIEMKRRRVARQAETARVVEA